MCIHLQRQEHEVYPGPGVPRLHGVEGGLVEAVLRRPPLAGKVELGVLATLPLLDRALDGKGELDLLRKGKKDFSENQFTRFSLIQYKVASWQRYALRSVRQKKFGSVTGVCVAKGKKSDVRPTIGLRLPCVCTHQYAGHVCLDLV